MDSAGRYGFMQISAHPAYTGSLLQRKLIDEADRSVGFKYLRRKQLVPEDGNKHDIFSFFIAVRLVAQSVKDFLDCPPTAPSFCH